MSDLAESLRAEIERLVKEEVARVVGTTPSTNVEQRYVDDHEVARMLSVTRPTLQAMRRAGKGPRYFRVARRAIRYDVRDVNAWLVEQRRG